MCFIRSLCETAACIFDNFNTFTGQIKSTINTEPGKEMVMYIYNRLKIVQCVHRQVEEFLKCLAVGFRKYQTQIERYVWLQIISFT